MPVTETYYILTDSHGATVETKEDPAQLVAEFGWILVNTEDRIIPVPEEITKRQLRLTLAGAGLLSSVLSYMDSLDPADPIFIEWDSATSFDRNHPLIESVGSNFGLSPDDIDNLYIAGAVL